MEKILAIIFTLVELSVTNRDVIAIYCRYSPLDNHVQLFVYFLDNSELAYKNHIDLAGESPLDELLAAEDSITDLIVEANRF